MINELPIDYRTSHLTPIAPLVGYVALTEPQGYQGSEPAYTCKIALEEDNTQKLLHIIDEAHYHAGDYLNAIAEKFGNRAKLTPAKLRKHAPMPYESELDEDGAETGRTIFKFRQSSTQYVRQEKVPFTLPIVDSQRLPMREDIYSGSDVIIKFVVKPWFVDAMGLGVSLRPQAVQCLKLVSSLGGSKGSDFSTIEGGYVATIASQSDPVAIETFDGDESFN
jgi:hypothetical protein